MNCQEFEQRVWAEPHCDEPGFVEHMQSCPDCGPLAAEVRAFDGQIGAALRVDCPDDLAARIRARQVLLADRDRESNGRSPWQRFRDLLLGQRSDWVAAYAVAATVLLVVGVLYTGVVDEDPRLMPIDRLVAEHTLNERYLLDVDMPMPRDEMAEIFGHFGAQLVSDIDGVTFANGCVLENGIKGAHLVLDTPQGKAIVLMIPSRRVDDAQALRFAGFEGRIAPYGQGSLAVISEQGSAVAPAEARIREAVRWL
ncbi:MAG: DUF3379 family protein [Gammaproteobacteria bacterium]|nr:DUF3379 family protein [Gammaproteobacteria bacterium]